MASTAFNVTSTTWESTGLSAPCLVQLVSSNAVEIVVADSAPSIQKGMQLAAFNETLVLDSVGTVYARIVRPGTATINITPRIQSLTNVELRESPIAVSGTVALDSGSLSALENINATVSGEVDVTPASPSAASYLPVRLTDGTAFYSATGGGGGSSNPNGQATMANSQPVVIALDQTSLEVSLDSFSLSALENITIDGSITVGNFPATQAVSASSLPLPTGAATETTLSSINTKLPEAITDMPSQTTAALPVCQTPQKYWDWSFASAVANGVDTSRAAVIATGAGMTVNQTGGNLVITAGTTINSETVIRSIPTWNGALTLWESTTLSARDANNNFFVEFVDVIGDGLSYSIVNATTVDVAKTAHGFTSANVGQRIDICAITGSAGVPMEAVISSIPNANTIRFTVAGWPASGSGTCSLTGWNKIEICYTGATATQARFNTRRQGYQNTAATPSINTTASGHIAAVNLTNGCAAWNDMVTTSAGSWSNNATWRTNIPEAEVPMYLQIRARNGTTAPAAVTWTLGMVRVEDFLTQQVEIANIKQTSTGAQMSIRGTVTAGISSGTSAIGKVAPTGIWWDDSSTVLAANATFTGSSRDLIATATATAFTVSTVYAKEFRASAESDQSGTLWVEVSRDNTNWRRAKSVATAAVTGGGQYAEIVLQPSWRYARAGFTNGATLQGRFTIGSVALGG